MVLCPFQLIAQPGAGMDNVCLEVQCALYHKGTGECAFLALVYALDGLGSVVEKK